MSSAVSLPNHTFTGQAQSSKRLNSIVHILSPETDNCPSRISGRERMTIENISWSISTKECCRPRRGLNPRPPGLQSDGASNWATKAGEPECKKTSRLTCAHKEDSNQSAHLRSLIKAFAVRIMTLCIIGYLKCGQWRFWSDCADAQFDLNRHWAHMLKGTFSHVVVHVSLAYYIRKNDEEEDENNRRCAPTNNPDQPVHSHIPNCISNAQMKEHWTVSYPNCTKQNIRLIGLPGWLESSLSTRYTAFFSGRCSYQTCNGHIHVHCSSRYK